MTDEAPSSRSLRRWLVAATAMIGVFVGLGLFTFIYAQGGSYLVDDPAACANCHVMWDQYDAWSRGSHKDVATCNDCHTPHGPISKWLVKGLNGFNHSLAFTLGNFPNNIRARPLNVEVAQENCVACHEVMVSQIHGALPEQERLCTDCHVNPGHGF
jgi:cytochrome c nitrite reductase small subunit